MKRHRTKNRNVRITLFILISILFILSSCVTQRQVEYLQDKNKDIKAFQEAGIEDYKLKPYDEVFVQVSSMDVAAANVFSNTRVNQSTQLGAITPYGASLLSYTVNDDGFLILPVVGNIDAVDKTLEQVGDEIKDSLTNVLNQPVVSLKLVNRYVSVIGEVATPGYFSYTQEKLSVHEALSMAGDITIFGNRKAVLLIRSENEINQRILLDLTKSDILSSEYYHIRPNDVIYVKPLRRKIWNMAQFPTAVILSLITTSLLIYTIIEP